LNRSGPPFGGPLLLKRALVGGATCQTEAIVAAIAPSRARTIKGLGSTKA